METIPKSARQTVIISPEKPTVLIGGRITLEAIRMVREELGVNMALGTSNVASKSGARQANEDNSC